MSRCLVLGCWLVLAATCHSQTATFRHFFAYGDEALVQLARQSGADSTAAVGKEIPQNVALHVPADGREFVVQYHMAYVSGTREAIWSFGMGTNFVFDRGVMSDGAVTDLSTVYSSESYRKLTPSLTAAGELANNFVNGQIFGAWQSPTTMFDSDADGVADNFVYDSDVGAIAGAANGQVAIMPREVGLHGSVRGMRPGFSTGGSRFARGESRHVIDISWKANLQQGEQYGQFGEETGLKIHTVSGKPSPSWGYTSFRQISQYYGSDPDWINIGAKYNLIGAALVPEPTVAVTLLSGCILVLRRKRR